jgi:hypothetical protein
VQWWLVVLTIKFIYFRMLCDNDWQCFVFDFRTKYTTRIPDKQTVMESNSSQNSSEETTGSELVLIWTMTFMSIIACVSNMLVIVTIFGTKTLRTISSVFLLNLTLCDFFIGLVMMPVMVNNVHNGSWVLSQVNIYLYHIEKNNCECIIYTIFCYE